MTNSDLVGCSCERRDLEELGLALGVSQDLADLGFAGAAIDAGHQAREVVGVRHPARAAAFGEATVVDELDAEPADGGHSPEHVALQSTGEIPHFTPTSSRIESENQPSGTRNSAPLPT